MHAEQVVPGQLCMAKTGQEVFAILEADIGAHDVRLCLRYIGWITCTSNQFSKARQKTHLKNQNKAAYEKKEAL